MELQAGQVVDGLRGRYRVRQRCGEGGFGLTYEGSAEGGALVAIKQLRFEKLRDWKALELFEREGRVLAQLKHSNIPAYVDFFAHDGERAIEPSQATQAQGAVSWFLVQQFVQGPSLQQVMQGQQRMGSGQLETLLRSLLATLDYLHSLHPPVVHRDINPKNIVLAPDGRPFLVDFGAIQDRMRFENQQGSTSVGTLGYMPLEQLRGAARPSSDLYALGMTMLALASGQNPSEMPVDESSGKVRIERVAPGLTGSTRQVLDRMIEPIVGQRIGSAREALGMMSARAIPVARPAGGGEAPSRTIAFVGAAAAVLTLAGVGVGVFMVQGQPGPPPPIRIQVPVNSPPQAQAVASAAPVVQAPPIPFTLTWRAQAVGDPKRGRCEVIVTGNARGNQFEAPVVVGRCGTEVLFHSQDQLEGTSMLSWDLSEEPVLGRAGVFRYRLRYSDVGPRTGARAQATIDTEHRQGMLFRETVPLYRVALRIEPDSATRHGSGLLARNNQQFSAVIERIGQVTEVVGKSPVAKGASCNLMLSPAGSELNCRARLTCEGKKLYGSTHDNGYARCDLERGSPIGFFDPGSDRPGDDPETRLDLKAGTLSLKEARGEPYEITVELKEKPKGFLGYRK
ncbi:MAG: protein kinase [Polyangiaceae bacterium]|jgi:hypothetical protein|nr:protein kinase [Polyangiaceae bacterium]